MTPEQENEEYLNFKYAEKILENYLLKTKKFTLEELNQYKENTNKKR